MPSPDFTMPPAAVSAPPPAALARPDPDGVDVGPGVDPSIDIGRRRWSWRHLAIAAAVGFLIGAGIPAGVSGVEHATADADERSLRATAMAYLDAIAAGDAATATAMVPPPGRGAIAPDAVLQAATPIASPEVWLVAIDGDTAIVEVGFELGAEHITRTLDAVRVDTQWQLGTTLAEPVAVPPPYGETAGDGVDIGGVTLETGGGALLYPGRYRVDVQQTRLLRVGGDPFEVDGDPETPVMISASAAASDALAAAAVTVARDRVGACELLAECPIDAQTVARPTDAIAVTRVDPAGRSIDLAVPLGLGSGYGGSGETLHLRALIGPAGWLVGWECSGPDDGGAFEPCGP